MNDLAATDRASSVRLALRLEWLTIGWNVIEGGVAITAAVLAGSVALLGFGIGRKRVQRISAWCVPNVPRARFDATRETFSIRDCPRVEFRGAPWVLSDARRNLMGPAEFGNVARVLVVDDDDDLREAMTMTLRRAGYSVIAASSGVEAVDACRVHRPDVAVLDVFLGDSGGLGVAVALREMVPDVRVLFVTGLTLPSVRDALAPAPVLFKPVRRRQLLESVRALARPDRPLSSLQG